MSRNLNRVEIFGQLGADPELNTTPSGVSVCNLRVATNEMVKGQSRTEWHRVVVWRGDAERCAQYLKKGSQVLVLGQLRTRQWEDKGGNTRYTTEINAKEVIFPNTNNKNDVPVADVDPQPTDEDSPF